MAKRADTRGLLRTLVVRRAARLPSDGGPMGHVKAGSLTLPCVLGRAGTTRFKREGDQATPAGSMRVLYGFYRPDRMARPFSRIPMRPVSRDLGWCDDAGSALYNRPGALPMRATHERMWREDGLYDVVFVLDYNIAPRRTGRGSAIFLHCAKFAALAPAMSANLKPTLGCVALRPGDMRRLLGRLAPDVRIVVL